MADFATVGELEAFMGSGSLGARGTAMLGYASALIRRATAQDLEVTTGRQESFAATTDEILILSQRPVTAIAVTVNAVAFTAFVWTRTGTLTRTDGTSWSVGPIVVTYDSGYATTDDEFAQVKGICLEAASRALGGPQDGAFASFGNEVQELRGAAPGLFLTQAERNELADLGSVGVG